MEKKHKIYIMMTRSGTILSKLIHLYTKSPYSHVSLSLDLDLEEVYSFGRYNPYNPIFAGFVREKIDRNGTYKRFPKAKCAVYSLDISEGKYKRLLREIEKFKEDKESYKYNLIGLIGVMLNIPVNREFNYFCTQFVSTVLKNSEINIVSKDPGLVTPDDFRTCEDLDLVYEGELDYIFEHSLYDLYDGEELV